MKNSKTTPTLIKNSIFNTWGTFFYFFCQWITTLILVRITGFASAGIYSLAISLTNIFGFISRFGVRNYQISDVTNKHTDGSYLATRLVTSILATVGFAIVLFILPFDKEAFWIYSTLFVFKLLESVTDVLFGVFQKLESYPAIALSYSLKGAIPLLLFSILLLWQKSLLLACIGMTGGYLLIILFYDIPKLLRAKNFTKNINTQGIKIILLASSPIMLYSLINPYMTFITRFAIEHQYSKEILGYYSSISMVLVVMSTLGSSIFAVLIPTQSAQFKSGKYDVVKKGALRTFLGIACVSVFACIVCFFFGDFTLCLLFGTEILPYTFLLIPIVLVSVLLTAVAYLSSLLVALEKQKSMLLYNSIGALVCTLSVNYLTTAFGMIGACLCLGISIGIQFILLIGCVFITLRKKPESRV